MMVWCESERNPAQSDTQGERGRGRKICRRTHVVPLELTLLPAILHACHHSNTLPPTLAQELDASQAEDSRADQILGNLRQQQERQLGARRAQRTVGNAQSYNAVMADLDAARARETKTAAAGQRRAVQAARTALATKAEEKSALAAAAEAEAQRKLRSLESLKEAVDHVAEEDRRRAIVRRKRRAQAAARHTEESARLLAKGENPDLVFLLRKKEAARRKRAAAEAQKRQQQAGHVAERLYTEAALQREEMTQRRERLRGAVLSNTVQTMQATARAQLGPKAPTRPVPQPGPEVRSTLGATARAAATASAAVNAANAVNAVNPRSLAMTPVGTPATTLGRTSAVGGREGTVGGLSRAASAGALSVADSRAEHMDAGRSTPHVEALPDVEAQVGRSEGGGCCCKLS